MEMNGNKIVENNYVSVHSFKINSRNLHANKNQQPYSSFFLFALLHLEIFIRPNTLRSALTVRKES